MLASPGWWSGIVPNANDRLPELARRIREMPNGMALPLILLSSGFMPGGAASGPFNARLLKPARQGQLFETLARR